LNLSEQLCLQCGLCCSGVIFADVRLQRGDNPTQLRRLGLPLSTTRGQPGFSQPCAALEGCRCRLYAERPLHCRYFECALFKNVKVGNLRPAAALRCVRTARARADKVHSLLRALGDSNENVALSARCRNISERLNAGELDRQKAQLYAQLTQAHHKLNLLLAEAFYPGTIIPHAR
jgi:hypothetical protein